MSIITNDDAAAFAELAAVFYTLPLPVAIVDLETTGGHFAQDRITEIAILRFHQGCISQHQWLVNPQQPISDFITKLTGISNEMVQDAPSFTDIAGELLPLLRGHLLVAHNSRFDYTFLRHAFARNNINFAAPTLDTVPFSRKLYPQHFKHNLDAIIARFEIDLNAADRHRAMGDVLALTEFLQRSLREHDNALWQSQWRAMIKPGYFPAWLKPELRQQLYALPDSSGLLLQHTPNQPESLMIVERAFTDICLQFQRQNTQSYWKNTTEINFIPAVSSLHALWLYGYYQLHPQTQTHLSKSSSPANWYTVSFVANQRGQLQARIIRLQEGILRYPPYGLFAHPRAAKRALSDWARRYDLCPAVLDILPQSISTHEPCPKQAAHLCDGHCRKETAMADQNDKVIQYAPLLPVCDWGKWHQIRVTETDAVTDTNVTIEAQAGCIRLDDQHWYFHPLLPKLLKQRLKKPENIEFIC
ncbi:3'-5' exonuclease [Snodgrassella sp. ESL0304]|uniref:3'-5' exonuclease n=1 Tax=Snodgrassella sp. ESL0304 TaxID=2705032 RepID=UPI001581D87A|nr:3'-5' exonuclease [Snodgrassella sp. ESL0304]NUE79872.1 3'-5' exonuclease [Snodgrassella sp. ESL0304]